MASRSERDSELQRRAVCPVFSITTVSAVSTVASVAARAWVLWIDRTHGAAEAVQSISPIRSLEAVLAGKTQSERAVVVHGDVEIGADTWLAGNRDGDVWELAVADPGVGRKAYDAFAIDSDDTRSD